MKRYRMRRNTYTVIVILLANKDTFESRIIKSVCGKQVQQYDTKHFTKGNGKKIVFRYTDGTISNAYVKSGEEIELISHENFKVWS